MNKKSLIVVFMFSLIGSSGFASDEPSPFHVNLHLDSYFSGAQFQGGSKVTTPSQFVVRPAAAAIGSGCANSCSQTRRRPAHWAQRVFVEAPLGSFTGALTGAVALGSRAAGSGSGVSGLANIAAGVVGGGILGAGAGLGGAVAHGYLREKTGGLVSLGLTTAGAGAAFGLSGMAFDALAWICADDQFVRFYACKSQVLQ
ncbi:MAG: hypothetical protein HY747_09810, partial [Elusimicrobia bacterium]|nr:hypothetical protein [Elusimicrobiota bacterium]